MYHLHRLNFMARKFSYSMNYPKELMYDMDLRLTRLLFTRIGHILCHYIGFLLYSMALIFTSENLKNRHRFLFQEWTLHITMVSLVAGIISGIRLVLRFHVENHIFNLKHKKGTYVNHINSFEKEVFSRLKTGSSTL